MSDSDKPVSAEELRKALDSFRLEILDVEVDETDLMNSLLQKYDKLYESFSVFLTDYDKQSQQLSDIYSDFYHGFGEAGLKHLKMLLEAQK